MLNDACILVVDDDPKIRSILRNLLEDEGCQIIEASDARGALEAVDQHKIDLITLDLQLGADDGLDIARTIRNRQDTPIVMVTGKDDVIDRVVGLELGADDYITKPFHLREVLARLRSVMRRTGVARPESAPVQAAQDSSPKTSAALEFDGLRAIPDRFELLDRNGAKCDLTSGDFKLLSVFLDHPKHVLSRDQLMDLTGGAKWTPLDRAIDNQVARLRKKIEIDPSDPQVIKTVRGVGYILACDVRRS